MKTNKQITISLNTDATRHNWIFNEMMSLFAEQSRFELAGIWIHEPENKIEDIDDGDKPE